MSRARVGLAAALLAAAACGPPRSSFELVLTHEGGRTERVGSGADVRGAVDNAGFLALDDQSWGLAMSLGGLASGEHMVSSKAGSLALVRKGSGDVWTTDLGGSCTVWLNPHASSNGSVVGGWFYCKALTSNSGEKVDVGSGVFKTLINDAANNPRLDPPI